MNIRLSAALVGSSAVASAALVTVSFWLALNTTQPFAVAQLESGDLGSLAPAACFILSCAAVGVLVVSSRPQHVVGWLLAALAVCLSLEIFSSQFAAYALLERPEALPAGEWAAWYSASWWGLGTLLLGFVLLLFPDGRLPSARWRPWIWLTASWCILAMLVLAIRPGPLFYQLPDGPLDNPAGMEAAEGVSKLLATHPAFFAGLLVSIPQLVPFGLGAVALLLRYHHAEGDERRQYKWVVSAGALFVTAYFVAQLIPLFAMVVLVLIVPWLVPQLLALPVSPHAVVSASFNLALWSLTGIPVAIGVAIFRYRLYDIDLIINRTVLYGSMTVILGGGFVFGSALTQHAVEAATGQRSEVLTLGVALAVAAGFQPLRRRTKVLVDQLLPSRQTLALLFTDIAGSTERAVALGDERWREARAEYRATVRRLLKRFGGHEVDTAGDGFFATFDRALPAVRCAQALAGTLVDLGLPTRVGLHWGECEMRGEKVSGVNVHVAARVMALASPGEVMISDVLREQLQSLDVPVELRGVQTLPGVPGEWALYTIDRA
jgi:class 3 adenylate cyclase